MAATIPTRRRWFQFGLGTMLLLVTIFALPLGWLGWQLQIVRSRQAVRKQIAASSGSVFVGELDWKGRSTSMRTVRPADYNLEISALRRRLGDEFVDLIAFSRQLTAADRRAIAVIPEAEILAIP